MWAVDFSGFRVVLVGGLVDGALVELLSEAGFLKGGGACSFDGVGGDGNRGAELAELLLAHAVIGFEEASSDDGLAFAVWSFGHLVTAEHFASAGGEEEDGEDDDGAGDHDSDEAGAGGCFTFVGVHGIGQVSCLGVWFEGEDGLAVFDGISVLDEDFVDGAAGFGGDVVGDAEGDDFGDDVAGLDFVSGG